MAFSLAIGLVYLTTAVDDLLADLARRGLGRRAIFVVGAAVQMVPATIERAGEIVDAQRSRGMDTEGRIWRRARGVLPLAAPVVFGALAEVEERTMALEARAFSAPGRQTLLRVPADRPVHRAIRWAAILALVVIVVLRATGRLG
jgi:energy-coupling factor transport system permease protein